MIQIREDTNEGYKVDLENIYGKPNILSYSKSKMLEWSWPEGRQKNNHTNYRRKSYRQKISGKPWTRWKDAESLQS